jgi:glycine dehydrogenase subunit 1
VVRGARFFNEFVLRTTADGAAVRRALAERGIRAGVPIGPEYGLGPAVTLAATELTTDADVAALVAALGAIGELAERREEVPA